MKRHKRNWSKLPEEVLAKIAGNLQLADYWRFRAVCRRWDFSHHFSYHLLYDGLPYRIPSRCPLLFKHSGQPLFLVASDVCLLQPLDTQSTKSWFVSVEKLSPGKLRFLPPLGRNPIKDSARDLPNPWDLSDFRVSSISIGFKLCFSCGNEDVFNYGSPYSWDCGPTKSKVVLDTDNGLPIENCIAMALLISKGGILVSLDLGTGKWAPIRFGQCSRFDDIVNFREHICAIDRKGRAFLINARESKVTEVLTKPMFKGYGCESRKLLVESNGELYMVRQLARRFVVYKLDERENKWDELNDLGNRILFVTSGDCFFVKAQEFSRCRGNCILFPKNCFPVYSGQSFDCQLFSGASKYLEIGVFYLDQSDFQLVSTYP